MKLKRELVTLRHDAAKILIAAGWTKTEAASALGYANRSPTIFLTISKTKKKADGRTEQMQEMARSGKSLTEIGIEFGLTRERVRQIFVKHGFSTTAWRAKKKGQKDMDRALAVRDRRDAKARHLYGVGYDELLAINNGVALSDACSKSKRWLRQKMSAGDRGIEWALTFTEWSAIWDESGKWHLCGRGRGRYCMSRLGDVGSYSAGNVRICLNEENISESYRVRPSAERGEVCVEYSLSRQRRTDALELSDEGKTVSEIATHFGVKNSYVRYLLAQGRRLRREELAQAAA